MVNTPASSSEMDRRGWCWTEIRNTTARCSADVQLAHRYHHRVAQHEIELFFYGIYSFSGLTLVFNHPNTRRSPNKHPHDDHEIDYDERSGRFFWSGPSPLGMRQNWVVNNWADLMMDWRGSIWIYESLDKALMVVSIMWDWGDLWNEYLDAIKMIYKILLIHLCGIWRPLKRGWKKSRKWSRELKWFIMGNQNLYSRLPSNLSVE